MTVRVLVCAYNAEPWIRKCLASIYAQDHKDFTVTVVDDASTDGTDKIIADMAAVGWTTILNAARVGATANIWNNTRGMDDNDILVLVDADDWLSCDDALTTIWNVYEDDPDCLLTYGDYVSSPHDPTCPTVEDFPRDVIRERSFRTASNVWNHPLSWRGVLFNRITEDELRLANGEWAPGIYDEFLMAPACELAGPNHRRIDRVLYVYNSENPISCIHTEQTAIHAAGLELRTRPKRNRLFRVGDGWEERDDDRTHTTNDLKNEHGIYWCVDLGTRSIDHERTSWHADDRVVTFHSNEENYYKAIIRWAERPCRLPVFGDPIECFPWVTDTIPRALWWVDGDDPRLMDLLFQVLARKRGDVIAVDDAWLAPVDDIRGQVAQLSEAFGCAYDVTVAYDVVRITPKGDA